MTDVILGATLLLGGSGLPALFFKNSSVATARLTTVITGVASLAGLWASVSIFTGPNIVASPENLSFISPKVFVDSLSAFFLTIIFLIAGLGSVFGLGYWPADHSHQKNRQVGLFWGLLSAGMCLLVASRDSMLFLAGWEIMAVSAFFLINTEDDKAECRRAAWIYLLATHIATLALVGLFVLWHHLTGSNALELVHLEKNNLWLAHAVFFAGLLGFGLKAGMMPLHFWLPGAHANAPSHVSAVLSGVMLKMGIYGILRVASLMSPVPALWGYVLLALGAASSLLGVAFAIAQHDLKRLLAYHSIENIGIILLGLGLALLGRASHQPAWVVLGLAGCLLHVWNHSFFKSLLFFTSGSILHATGTRQMDRLGGLAKHMPVTAALFAVGAVAICGLPPLNGFVSEWFIYSDMFKLGLAGGVTGKTAIILVPVLAMVGALAVACFTKVFGVVFLGNGRHEEAEHAHEASWVMLMPMGVLAFLCVAIGLFPSLVAPWLDRAIASCAPGFTFDIPALSGLLPLAKLGGFARLLSVALLATAAAGWVLQRRKRTGPTWDCGYARPDARMQYTASSFGRWISAFFGATTPEAMKPTSLTEMFPDQATFADRVKNILQDEVLKPSLNLLRRATDFFHPFQQGSTQSYLFYMLVILIAMLSTILSFNDLFNEIFFF